MLNVLDIQKHYVPAGAVFAGVIRSLKDDLLQQLQNRGYHHGVDDIQFVVTVPAIWSDTAKQAMTEFSVKVANGPPASILNFSRNMRIKNE